jgi:uncharacterized repeat protein (TIGR02543 family)
MLEQYPFRSSIPIDLTLNTDALYVDSTPKFISNVEPSANKVHIPSNSFYVSNGSETKLTKDLYATAFGGATVIAPTTDISSAELTFDKPSVAYTGNEITPVLTVKYGDKTLTADVDYEIADSSITSATEAGDYTITINGIGDYSGTVSSVWQITTAIYLTKVEATAATGDTAGNVEYYEGSDANYYLLQNGRYKETTLEEIKELSESSYTVIWKNYDDTTLETDAEVAYGATPEYNSDTPIKAADAQYTYTFSGWSDGTNTYGINDALPAVTGDVTYTAQFSEEVNKTTTLKGRSISLGGDIGVNFYYEISSDIAANAKAEFTVGGVTQTVDGVYDSDKGQYKFTVLVNSSQTSQNITCKIVSDDYVSEEVTYSVNQYIDSIKDDTNYNSNEKLMALVNAISVYGYYANEQFGTDGNFTKAEYFNDDFINKDKTEYAADLESLCFNSYTATNGTDLSYYGSSLLLESKTTLRHYFTLNEGQNIDGVTFTVGSTTVSPKYKDGLYYVDIPNISSAELYNKQTITGSDGTTVEYYPLTYAYKVLTNANSSEKLINVVKALCEYAKCADNYFPKQ